MRYAFIALLFAAATGLLPFATPTIDQVNSARAGGLPGCARCGGARTQGDGTSVTAPSGQAPDTDVADPREKNECHVEVREVWEPIAAREYYKVCP